MTDYAPCTTCGQYSHSIGEGQVTAAFNHFQSMYSHRSDGIPTQNVYDDRTRDAAQVLMAAARGMLLREDAGTAAEAEDQQPGGEATRPNTLDYANKSEREAAYWREEERAAIVAWLRDPRSIVEVMREWEDHSHSTLSMTARENRGVAFIAAQGFADRIEHGDHLVRENITPENNDG